MTVNELIQLVDPRDIDNYAAMYNVDPIALRSQTLLHLPRFNGSIPVKAEMKRIAALLQSHTMGLSHHVPPLNNVALRNLEFIKLGDDEARMYHENYHYIGSYRPGHHYGYLDKISGKLVCIGSVAACDLAHVLDKIKEYIKPEQAMVLTRFFAFRWAPENTFSHFVRSLKFKLVKDFKTQILFTFINPNLAFNGGSHIGATFKPFAFEEGTNYMYLDGQYCTMRQLVKSYGTSNAARLQTMLGDSFHVSDMELLPMEIMAKTFNRRAAQAIPKEPYLFRRPIL